MAKFYGKIGFIKTVETEPESGVWKETPIERTYYGDVIRHSRSWSSGENVNDDFTINNEISIVADSYAIDNAYLIRYVFWKSVPWKITSVDVQFPRLTLNIGGVYNGETLGSSEGTN